MIDSHLEAQRRGRASLLALWSVLAAGLAWGAHLSWSGPGTGQDASDGAGREEAMPAGFYCPMHPSYHSSGPGDCPLCNMDMVPMQEGAMPEVPVVEGHSTVRLSPSRRQLIGVRTERVESERCRRHLRLPARVEVDRDRVFDVSLKTTGWVDELFVRWEGARVEEGEPLFTLYSPDMFETQRKYILAHSLLAQNLTGGASEIEASRRQQIEVTRARLLLWDLTDDQIASLEQPGAEPQTTTRIVARKGGVVLSCKVVQGARVEPGMSLYQIANLDTVWVVAEAYESDLPALIEGAQAEIELDSRPGEPLSTTIDYVYPTLDPRTRTAQVRFVVENSFDELRPGMYATATIAVDLGEAVTVGASAVLDSGMRQLVFVELAPGEYEPREVVLGERCDGRVIVREGLEEGERVVTSGTFLIDSESRLQAALSALGDPEEAP